MNSATLITPLQFEALALEVERQLRNESDVVIAAAQREAAAIVAQARAAARRRMHEAVVGLRRTRALRLARAKAQRETAQLGLAQRRATEAVSATLPLLRVALDARWSNRNDRRQWTDAVARLCVARLRARAWRVEHPSDWSEAEQREFLAAVGARKNLDVAFTADGDLGSGLRVKADQATLDATPAGLLADARAIAGLILDEITQGAAPQAEVGERDE